MKPFVNMKLWRQNDPFHPLPPFPVRFIRPSCWTKCNIFLCLIQERFPYCQTVTQALQTILINKLEPGHKTCYLIRIYYRMCKTSREKIRRKHSWQTSKKTKPEKKKVLIRQATVLTRKTADAKPARPADGRMVKDVMSAVIVAGNCTFHRA